MTRKTLSRALLAGVAVAVIAGIAHAGLKWTYPVFVSTLARLAHGNMGYARNSPDTVQKIGCKHWVTSAGEFVSCSATNNSSPPITGSCYASGADVVRFRPVLNSMTVDSFILFSWDSAGKCTRIDVENASELEPKQ